MEAIKFGASISCVGRYSLQGRQARAGLQAWAEHTNRTGGISIPGRGAELPVAPVVHDDRSSRAGAVTNVERLIADDRVDVLIGPYGSDLARAVVPVVARHGRVMWNHGGASDDVHQPGSRVVGILTPVSRYFAGFLDIVPQADAAVQQVVVLYREGSRFGLLAAQGAKEECRLKGLTSTPLTYSSLRTDLPSLLKQLRGLRPDIVLCAGAFEDDCTLARGIVLDGMGNHVLGCVAAGVREFGEVLGAETEGVFGPSQWARDADWAADFGPSGPSVASSIQALNVAPDYPAAQAYASCLIAQRCLEIAGTTEDAPLWEAACSLDCTTFFGPFKIDPATGLQLQKQMVWVQWSNGEKRTVQPPTGGPWRGTPPESVPL